MLDKIGHADV